MVFPTPLIIHLYSVRLFEWIEFRIKSSFLPPMDQSHELGFHYELNKGGSSRVSVFPLNNSWCFQKSYPIYLRTNGIKIKKQITVPQSRYTSVKGYTFPIGATSSYRFAAGSNTSWSSTLFSISNLAYPGTSIRVTSYNLLGPICNTSFHSFS